MTDAVREKFEREYKEHDLGKDSFGDYNHQATEDAFLDYSSGYTAAHEEAKALVGELYDYIMNDECTQYLPEKLLTKAQAFMEGKV